MAAPTFVGIAASSGVGSTSVTVPYPVTATLPIRVGDILVIGLTSKYPSNAPTTPSGWTLETNAQTTGGQGASAADTGNVYATAYWKSASSTDVANQVAATGVTISISSGNSAVGQMLVVRPVVSRFSTISAQSANSTLSVNTAFWTLASLQTLALQPDDFVIAVQSMNSDGPTTASEAFAQTSITFGSVTERTDTGTTTGDDCGLVMTTGVVTAGTATGTFTYSSTLSSAKSGCGVFLVIRETAATSAAAVSQQQVEVLHQASGGVLVEQQQVEVLHQASGAALVEQQQVEVLESVATPRKQKPLMWLRAEDLTGSDNDQITSWVDQSGNSNNATGAGATKPLYRTASGPNSGKAVEFTAVGYFTLSTFMSAAAQGDIFVVIKSDGNNCGHWAFGADTNVSDESYYPFGGSIYDSFGKATNDRSGPLTPGVTVTNWHVYNVYSAANDWQAYQNNGSIGTDTTNVVTWTSNPRLGMGRKSSADDLPFDGMMAEVIFWDRKLSAAERLDVYNYLNDKYLALTANISATTVAAVATVGSPTVTTDSVVAAATVAGTATVGAGYVAPAQGGTVSGSTSMAAVNLFMVAGVDTVSGSTTIGAPTFTSDALVMGVTVSGVTTIESPTVISDSSIDATATVSTVDGVASVGTAVTQAGAVVSVTTVNGTTTIAGFPTQAPTTVNGSVTIGAPTVSTDVLISVTTVSGTTSVGSPTVTSVALVSAVKVSGTTTIGAPTVIAATDATVSPATVSAVATVGSVVITATVTMTWIFPVGRSSGSRNRDPQGAGKFRRFDI